MTLTSALRRSSLALACLAALACVEGGESPSCPVDEFALWTSGSLRGANLMQARNPDGPETGFGDLAFAQSDFDALAAAGANYVHISHGGILAEEAPYAVDPAALENLDRLIAMAERAGLYVGIAFRSGPGRNEESLSYGERIVDQAIFRDEEAQKAWATMLGLTALRYRDSATVVGYSVMVEPNAYGAFGHPGPDEFIARVRGTLADVNRLHALATAAIREFDPVTPVLLEPDGYAGVSFLATLEVSTDSRTVYTVHDFAPFYYTQQLVEGLPWPGEYDLDWDGRTEWADASALSDGLEPVRRFASARGVPVAVTEFGVRRHAPDAAAYLAARIPLHGALGSWAIWLWQPAGSWDSFSLQEASALRTVFEENLRGTCRRP